MNPELDNLAAEAAAIDLEAAPAAPDALPGEPAADLVPQVNPVESLAGFVQVLGIAAGYAGFPKAAGIWTPDTCRALADKAVPVLAKYAWGQRVLDFLATGAGVEELALIATAAPLVLATVAAARDDLKPAKQTAPPEAAPA